MGCVRSELYGLALQDTRADSASAGVQYSWQEAEALCCLAVILLGVVVEDERELSETSVSNTIPDLAGNFVAVSGLPDSA